MSDPSDRALETATLGGGCFWCLDAVYREVPGVDDVVSGYAGGHLEDPGYRQVCSGGTGHAEVVQVTFDPELLPYRRVLEIFFTVHDPTQLDRQGADVGTQYRSAIFVHSDEQRRTAEEVIEEMEGLFSDPIVTRVEALPADAGRFWPAEDYHQRYYEKNPHQGYCRVVIDPKLAKYRARFGGDREGRADGAA